MLKQKQLFRHNPPATYGDCYRASLACLLEVPVTAIPHLGDKYWDQPGKWDEAMNEWLQKHLGFRMLQIVFNSDLQSTLDTMDHLNRGLLYLLTGMSKNNVPHMVVAGNKRIEWDPSLDNSGIVGPVEGCYWITLLVPALHFAKL